MYPQAIDYQSMRTIEFLHYTYQLANNDGSDRVSHLA
jgi:hypothetical protein